MPIGEKDITNFSSTAVDGPSASEAKPLLD
jgi:hypothetical protein